MIQLQGKANFTIVFICCKFPEWNCFRILLFGSLWTKLKVLCCFAEFSGQEIHSSVVFNPAKQFSVLAEDVDSEVKGAVVSRNCPLLIFGSVMFATVNWETLWPAVSRSTAGVLAVTKRGWFTTPDRCALQMKDRQSSSPAYTAGSGQTCFLLIHTLNLFLSSEVCVCSRYQEKEDSWPLFCCCCFFVYWMSSITKKKIVCFFNWRKFHMASVYKNTNSCLTCLIKHSTLCETKTSAYTLVFVIDWLILNMKDRI